MATTKRVIVVQKRTQSREVEEGSDTLSMLKELSAFSLILGGELGHVSASMLLIRVWLMGHEHFILFEGDEEEIRPLIKAAFAFARANEVSEVPGFLSSSKRFYEFLEMSEIMEITDAAWRNKPLMLSSVGMGKFAFLIGAGIKPSDPSLGRAINSLSMDDLFALAQLSRMFKRPLEKVLKIID